MRRLSRTRIALAILLAASVVFLLVSLRGGSPPGSGGRAAGAGKQGRGAAKEAGQELRPAAPADVDFRRYASLASSNIFSESRAKPVVPGAGKKVIEPPNWPRPDAAHPSGPPMPDFSGWTYVGYVALDGEKLGAIHNEATITVHFLAVGDDFMGAEVQSVDRESMRLSSGGSTTTLSRPRDFPVKPLDQAPGAGPQSRQGPPEPPGP
jgi:hypothetical protein